MEKTATLNIRVNPTVKNNAEDILNRLGIPMSTAIDMFLRQISLKKGIPFPLDMSGAEDSIDISQMTDMELDERLMAGYEDYKSGRVRNAKQAFAEFRKTHS